MKQLSKKEIKKVFKNAPKREMDLILVLENIQYATNVASMFRTADAAGVKKIFLTGISHKPPFGKDLRKTSRAKEDSVNWEFFESTTEVINKLKKDGFYIVAIELTDKSVDISNLKELISNKKKVCFVAGSEVFGVKRTTLELVDIAVTIPMYGKGASLNVSTSVGIALYSF